MRIFFSSVPNKEAYEVLINEGCHSFLLSFESTTKCLKGINYLETVKDKPIVVIIDSGAFSTWNKGLHVSKTDYFYFMKRVTESGFPHKIYFMNLDVIPHQKGTTPTKDQLKMACEKGIENYHWFKDRGVKTVHTFHQFEDLHYLEIILKECNDMDLVGVSPANDCSSDQRISFLKETFAELKQRTRAHILGFTAKEALQIIPCYSTDSTTWLNPDRYGETFNYRTMDKIAKQALTANDLLYYKQNGGVINAIRYFAKLEKYTTKLWTERGIAWND